MITLSHLVPLKMHTIPLEYTGKCIPYHWKWIPYHWNIQENVTQYLSKHVNNVPHWQYIHLYWHYPYHWRYRSMYHGRSHVSSHLLHESILECQMVASVDEELVLQVLRRMEVFASRLVPVTTALKFKKKLFLPISFIF